MMIMLATALSIFAVAVREKKGAGTTAASMQAFAVADSGSEIALQQVDRNPTSPVNSLGTCTGSTVTINVASGTADLTFYSDEEAATPIACNGILGDARKVKSVGRYAGTARAVEVAVAASAYDNGCIICDVPANSGKSCTLKANKVYDENICADSDGCNIHVLNILRGVYSSFYNNYENVYFIQQSDGKWVSDCGIGSATGTNGNGNTTTETLSGVSALGDKIWDDKSGSETSSDSIYVDNTGEKTDLMKVVICDEG